MIDDDLVLLDGRELPGRLRTDRTPGGRAVRSAWYAARQSSPGASGPAWQCTLMAELMGRGRTDVAERLGATRPGPWQPRWVTRPALEPALLLTATLSGSVTSATTVRAGGHLALFFGTSVRNDYDIVHTVDLRDGSVSEMPVYYGDDDFYIHAAFGTMSYGTVVAAATNERTLVWDVTTGDLLMASDPDDVPRRAGGICSVRPGRIGADDVVVVGTEEGYLLGWRVSDGDRIAKLTGGHTGSVHALALSTDGPPIAVSADDTSVCFWDLSDRTPIGEPRPVAGAVSDATWTDLDGEPHAVTVAEDGTLEVWHPHRPGPLVTSWTGLDTPDVACTVVDGRPIAVVGGDGLLRYVDLASGDLVGEAATDFDYSVGAVAVTPPDASTPAAVALQTIGGPQRINVFEIVIDPPGTAVSGRTDVQPRSVSPKYEDAALLTLTGQALVATIASDRRFRLYDAATGVPQDCPADAVPGMGYGMPSLGCTTIGGRPVGVTLTRPGRFVAVHLDDGSVHASPAEGPVAVWMLAVCDTGHDQIVATADAGDVILTHDLRTRRRIGDWRGAPRSVRCLATAEVGGHVVVLASGPDGIVHRLDPHGLPPWKPPFSTRPEGVTRLDTMTTDGEATLAAVHPDGVVSSWNVRTGHRHGPDLCHDTEVTAATTAPADGTATVITATRDRVVRIWNLDDGHCIDSFTAPRPVIRILRPDHGGVLLVDTSGLTHL